MMGSHHPPQMTQACREHCSRVCFEVFSYQTGVLNVLSVHERRLSAEEIHAVMVSQQHVRATFLGCVQRTGDLKALLRADRTATRYDYLCDGAQVQRRLFNLPEIRFRVGDSREVCDWCYTYCVCSLVCLRFDSPLPLGLQSLSNFGDSSAGAKMFRKNENRAELYVSIQGATFEVGTQVREHCHLV
jgi:hypothetical protein